MWLNVLIAVLIGVATYGLTMSLDHASPMRPDIIQAPVAGGVSNASVSKAQNVSQEVEKIPEFSFMDRAGKTHDITAYAGKIVVLNFWASWCPPCIEEFPTLLDIARNNPDDVVLIAVSSDFKPEAMERFLKTMDLRGENVVIARDPNGAITQKKFQTYRLPETIVVDRNQNMRFKITGADWDLKFLQTRIDQLQ